LIEESDSAEYYHLVSPTVFRWKEYRFFFFSREESKPHIHVRGEKGEMKLWLDPAVEIAYSHGLAADQSLEIKKKVEEKRDDIVKAWHTHFGS
jgi:hypothetical protein